MIFIMTDEPERVDSFVASLRKLGAIDVCRAGIFALDYEEQGLQSKKKHEIAFALSSS